MPGVAGPTTITKPLATRQEPFLKTLWTAERTNDGSEQLSGRRLLNYFPFGDQAAAGHHLEGLRREECLSALPLRSLLRNYLF